MKKSQLHKIIQEEINKTLNEQHFDEYVDQEIIDRVESIGSMGDQKRLHDMLRIVVSDWMNEGLEKEEIKKYISYLIEHI